MSVWDWWGVRTWMEISQFPVRSAFWRFVGF
jgi:hypothetical protein